MSARHAHRSRGFSMIELMVALVLGLILMGGVISVYTTNKKSYSLNIALGQVQESGRFAFNYLEPPIRMAGFYGCAHQVTPVSVLNSTPGQPETYDTGNAILGYEYTGTGIGGTLNVSEAPSAATDATAWSPSLPPDIASAVHIGGTTGQAIQGSDILVLHEAVPGGVNLTNPYQDTLHGDSVKILAADAGKVNLGEIVLVTDCSQSRLMQITNISSGGGKTSVEHSGAGTYSPGDSASTKFLYQFKAGSQIMTYETFIFYVGIGADGGPSLFEVSMGSGGALNPTQEMVPGVDTVQFLYGVDQTGDQIPDYYTTADNIASTDWGKVVSVRIALLTRSDGNVTDSKPLTTFTLLDPTAADGLTVKASTKSTRLREVFDETVSIRNRLP